MRTEWNWKREAIFASLREVLRWKKLHANFIDFWFLFMLTDMVSFLAILFLFFIIIFLSYELSETLFYGILFDDIGCPVSLLLLPLIQAHGLTFEMGTCLLASSAYSLSGLLCVYPCPLFPFPYCIPVLVCIFGCVSETDRSADMKEVCGKCGVLGVFLLDYGE